MNHWTFDSVLVKYRTLSREQILREMHTASAALPEYLMAGKVALAELDAQDAEHRHAATMGQAADLHGKTERKADQSLRLSWAALVISGLSLLLALWMAGPSLASKWSQRSTPSPPQETPPSSAPAKASSNPGLAPTSPPAATPPPLPAAATPAAGPAD